MTDTIRPYAPRASFHLGMRAADADRERAVGVLRAGFAERRLTKDEYDERITAVLAARTYGELSELTVGLPAGPLPSLSPPLKTNKTAIKALTWAVFTPFLLVLIPLGIGTTLTLAAEAREEIEETGEPGGRLALAARVIGYCMIAAFILAIVLIPHLFHVSNTGPPDSGMGQ